MDLPYKEDLASATANLRHRQRFSTSSRHSLCSYFSSAHAPTATNSSQPLWTERKTRMLYDPVLADAMPLLKFVTGHYGDLSGNARGLAKD